MVSKKWRWERDSRANVSAGEETARQLAHQLGLPLYSLGRSGLEKQRDSVPSGAERVPPKGTENDLHDVDPEACSVTCGHAAKCQFWFPIAVGSDSVFSAHPSSGLLTPPGVSRRVQVAISVVILAAITAAAILVVAL